MKTWNLTDADGHLSEIVLSALCCGAQRVTLDDEVEFILLGEEEYARLTGEPPADRTEPERGLGMFTALRQGLKEVSDDADACWPWEWDCEKREWVLPVDHALSP